ncbi:MAG: hypothetical protein ACLU8D_10720 [Enterocloster sp.]
MASFLYQRRIPSGDRDLFVICGFSFARLNRCTDELVRVTGNQKEYKEAGEKNLWASYCERRSCSRMGLLKDAFERPDADEDIKDPVRVYSVCDVEST